MLIAKSMKPFAKGEFIEECLMAAVDILDPEIKPFFSR